MTPRQHTVLTCVVDTHIETAQPVGSRLLRERYRMGFSPATLRNEMGTLEDMGYLMHRHTSSGRVPTDQGYRYYVNQLLSQQSSRIPANVMDLIQGGLTTLSREVDDPEPFVEESTRFLAGLAREASLVLLDGSGGTMSRRHAKRLRMYLEGSSHILDKPEFQDIEKVRALFQAFEEKVKLSEWITELSDEANITICIGQENAAEAFQECTVIATHYFIGGERTGTVALVGPRRMRYIQTIPLVACMANLMGKILEERF